MPTAPSVSLLRRVTGIVSDAGLLVLGVYLIPIAIIIAGAPVVLVVWLVLRFAA